MRIAFEVEQAGCEACGRLVTTALAPHGAIETLTIDEEADLAAVVLDAPVEPQRSQVDESLAGASAGAGHAYRVRPGSWRVL